MEDSFLEELRRDFAVEATEYLSTIRDILQDPKSFEDPKMIEEACRIFHNLKGASQTVGYPRVSLLCQSMESLLSAARKGSRSITPSDLPVIASGLETLESLINGTDVPIEAVARGVEDLLSGKVPSPTNKTPQEASDAAGQAAAAAQEEHHASGAENSASAEVPEVEKASAEPEPQGVPPAAEEAPPIQPAERVDPQGHQDLQREHDDTVRVRFKDVEEFITLLEDLMSLRLYAAQKAEQLFSVASEDKSCAEARPVIRGLREDLSAMDRAIKTLMQKARDMGMIRGDWLLRFLKNSAVGLAIKLSKSVDVHVSGGDVRLDRRVMETLKDPLMHLIRNAMDHGIESPEEREKQGKPRSGTIWISISADGSDCMVTVRDDGRGMDPEAIKAKALKDGLISLEQSSSMGTEEALHLIFQSGFSTAQGVSDVSGRGIGMSIVREALDKIGGTIKIATSKGLGTEFSIRFPSTVRTYRGVMVRVGSQVFSIPSSQVSMVYAIKNKDHQAMGIAMGKERYLPAIDLKDLFGLKGNSSSPSKPQGVVILSSDGEEAGVIKVDQILGEHEGIVKGLGTFLGKVRFFVGGTILGSGIVLPVLDVKDLLDSIDRDSAPFVEEKTSGPKKVLVAEDSVTSRALLKNIIGSLGYQVVTASDGQDAWERLSKEDFDLVVTDVEMPRMDGIGLLKRIRSNPPTSRLPVIVVTSLDSQEQVKMGMEAGADVYISKKDFDQDKLKSLIWGFLG
ncbi:chemotaxis protein histidine kinase-like protein [Thermanaerovibrio velox DSM 12556]|uniref:histidine kinase n=1 Tax=Thermanaerovibrio velox DSM 12556 TaxID=926567 RepID=H0UPC4_9BACT|nr:response regulator [Thermanaerovibrio velox]EHM10555.1 chemotaxis protein histidine kinase-like protein [Thermanaerovibrio velox DSM 12556]